METIALPFGLNTKHKMIRFLPNTTDNTQFQYIKMYMHKLDELKQPCCAIEPDYPENIDKITGDLKLL